MSALELADVSFSYGGGGRVLDQIDLELAAGRFLSLLGPNGSGKSTLLRIAAGLLLPGAGSARWGRHDLYGWDRLERARHLAFLPQNVESVYRHTAWEAVALGRHPHRGAWAGLSRQDRFAITEAMERTETEQFASRPLTELSGGEKQRVLIASALAQGGDLLLLDEPTAALDLHHQIRLMDLLRELAQSGRAVLCATHDLNLAAAFSHGCLLLDGGRIVAEGDPVDVLSAERLHRVYGEGIWVGPHPTGSGMAVLPKGPAELGAGTREERP